MVLLIHQKPSFSGSFQKVTLNGLFSSFILTSLNIVPKPCGWSFVWKLHRYRDDTFRTKHAWTGAARRNWADLFMKDRRKCSWWEAERPQWFTSEAESSESRRARLLPVLWTRGGPSACSRSQPNTFKAALKILIGLPANFLKSALLLPVFGYRKVSQKVIKVGKKIGCRSQKNPSRYKFLLRRFRPR